MQTPPVDIELLLPFGELLRGFMEQSFISPVDLKHTLRTRGVFISRTEKRDTIPALVCCLLSPCEFDELRECQATREDNPKTVTQTIAWASSKSLLDAVPPDLRLADLIAGEFTNFKVIGAPAFVPVGGNPDNIACEFEIERMDFSKNWAATKSNFKGKLRIEKAPGGKSIKFILTNTADETKDLNRRFVRHLTTHFQDSGHVSRESELETILFSSFDNEGRVAFFLSLLQGRGTSGFEFAGITDFGACPDKQMHLPKEVKWMEGKVRGLEISGVALEDTFFFKNKDLHRFLLLYSILAKFKFEYADIKGTCSVTFEFPDFASKLDTRTELEVNITSLTLDPAASPANRLAVKEELLRRINDHKLTQFERHRNRNGLPLATVSLSPRRDSNQLSLPMPDLADESGGSLKS